VTSNNKCGYEEKREEQSWTIKPEEYDTVEGIFKLAQIEESWRKLLSQLDQKQRHAANQILAMINQIEGIQSIEVYSEYNNGLLTKANINICIFRRKN